MLGAAENNWVDDAYSPPAPAPVRLAVVGQHAMAAPAVPPARYGRRGGVNVPAVCLIILVHAGLIGALAHSRMHVHRHHEPRLSVVNLTPPPPPPAAETPPPPAQPKVSAPPPLVQIPQPETRMVAPTPDPVPAPFIPTPAPATVIAPSAPSATPGPALPSIVQGGDIGAQMVAGKPPRYPVESRRRREQGTVVLALTLGMDGAVENIAVRQSSGFPRLDNAARDAVRGWRWKPVMRSGQVVRVSGVVEIPFVLRADAG